MTITCLNPSSIQKRNIAHTSKANISSSSNIKFPLTIVFDHIWTLTTNNKTVRLYELFKIWNYLEIELIGDSSINPYAISDKLAVHSQESKRHEFLEEINKDQAFNILYQTIVLSNDIFPWECNNSMSTDCNSEDDVCYCDSAAITTPGENNIESKNTTTQHCRIVSKKLDLGSTLKELEELHAKLNKKYITIENKLFQLERRNSFDVTQLETLTKRNLVVSGRISNIKNELLATNKELSTINHIIHFSCFLGLKSYEFLLSLLTCYLILLLLKGIHKVRKFNKIQVDHLSPANTAELVHMGSNINHNIRIPCEFLTSIHLQEDLK